jgi:hypothetical protein
VAYPVLESSSTGGGGTTNHSITLPAEYVAGDLLVVLFANRGGGITNTSTSGWTRVFSAGNADSTTQGTAALVLSKIASSGSESLSVTLSGFAQARWIALRISGADSITLNSTEYRQDAPSSSFDPPSHTNPNGSKDILWISAGLSQPGTHTYSNQDSRFTGTIESAGSDVSMRIISAFYESTSATIDPSAWTVSTPSNGYALTIAVEPLASLSLPPHILNSSRNVAHLLVR